MQNQSTSVQETLFNKILVSDNGDMNHTQKGIPDLNQINNKDDRREIWILLDKLTPKERCQFLEFVVNQVNQGIKLKHNPPWVLVEVTNNSGETNEVYIDLAHIVSQYRIGWNPVLTTLERFVAHQSCDSLSSQKRS